MPRSKTITEEEIRKKVIEIYQSTKCDKAISKVLGLHRTTARAIISKWNKLGTGVNLPTASLAKFLQEPIDERTQANI